MLHVAAVMNKIIDWKLDVPVKAISWEFSICYDLLQELSVQSNAQCRSAEGYALPWSLQRGNKLCGSRQPHKYTIERKKLSQGFWKTNQLACRLW